nr:diaminopimelate epimerase [Miniimonas sp. S16]
MTSTPTGTMPGPATNPGPASYAGPASNPAPASSSAEPVRRWPDLVKGHGTGNDFVLLTDADAALDLDPVAVASLTDRHRGLGADGLIRAVRTQALLAVEPGLADVLGADAARAEWFMDYRNADGSVAEMCGNGIRVYVRYLVDQGLVALPDGAALAVGTRAGVLDVRAEGDLVAVAMGRWGAPGGDGALAAGFDAEVSVAGVEGARPGLSITMPNPHVVIAVASDAELAAADLARPPAVVPVPSQGTNVEIVQALGERVEAGTVVGEIRMRVHERGVGETLSCGTGACAAAVAARVWAGPGAPDVWDVHVPGGTVRVVLAPDGEVELIGPAVLVADVRPR